MIKYLVGKDRTAAYAFSTQRDGDHLESIKINNHVFAEFDSMEKAETFAEGYNTALRELQKAKISQIPVYDFEFEGGEKEKYYLITGSFKQAYLETSELIDENLEYHYDEIYALVYTDNVYKAMQELEKKNILFSRSGNYGIATEEA